MNHERADRLRAVAAEYAGLLAVLGALVLAFGLSLVLVGAYGVLQGGYPQPSDLGWL